MPSIVSGKLTEVIYARLEPGEDLRQGLLSVIKQKKIKTGVVLSITGVLDRATVERFSRVGEPDTPVEIIQVPGPLEISAHGIIGEVEAPSFGDTPFGVGDDFVHGEPYLHVHITATSARETICGHLLDGSPVRSAHPKLSHFTVVLGRVEGAMLKMAGKPGESVSEQYEEKWGLEHKLVQS